MARTRKIASESLGDSHSLFAQIKGASPEAVTRVFGPRNQMGGVEEDKHGFVLGWLTRAGVPNRCIQKKNEVVQSIAVLLAENLKGFSVNTSGPECVQVWHTHVSSMQKKLEGRLEPFSKN